MATPSEPLPVGETADRHVEVELVVPVYNERDSVGDCARSWISVLDHLDVDYAISLLDDGSTDDSAEVLTSLARHPRVRSITKPNEGHGPTILRGYLAACTRCEWVFQADSDDEIPATAFPAMWEARHGRDAVFGVRVGRSQKLDRRVISAVARLSTRVLFGAGITDVNVPYRLMRAEVLGPIADRIPVSTFAPNIAIAGAFVRGGATIAEVDVPHRQRRAGTVSIVGWATVRAAARSLIQTVRLSRTLR